MPNCWEVMNCGRKNGRMKGCPAYPHHGKECFAVTGTMCRGQQHGSYKEKIEKCRKECAFYAQIMNGDATEDLRFSQINP